MDRPNHDGISQADELQPLHASDLIALELTYQTAGRRDRHANAFRQRAKTLTTTGQFYVYDVWLNVR